MHKFLVLIVVFSKLMCNDSSSNVVKLLEDDLSQFEQKGGEAKYALEDGVLTGTAVWKTPNTFLCTKEKYKDFILDYSIKVDPRLNSGVQIRSQTFIDKNKYEMLRGYQVEIDPSDRAWSGGIYEERGRGWIGSLTNNPKGREAFKNGEWNHYHVEAIGNSVKVWVNGVNTVNLLDAESEAGIIGLQVHEIYDEEHIGATIQWKDIILITNQFAAHLKKDEALAPEINLLANELSDKEKADGWLLFDRDNIPMQQPGMELRPWNISQDQFCSFEDTNDRLRLKVVDGDFEVKFEYKINKSGMAQLNYGYVGDPYSFMLTDDANVDEEVPGHMKAGSIANFMEAFNLSNPERPKPMRLFNQWSQAHIIVSGDNIKHWLNNSLVVDVNVANFQDENKQRLLEFQSSGSSVCVRSIKVLIK